MFRKLDVSRLSLKATDLTTQFSNRIVGQSMAVDALVRVLEKYQSGFYDKKKPIASLLFLGPTGVGKTGATEAFVEGLFGDVKALMKVDCAEFQHSHEIAKLVGSPPGYLGHRETHPFFTNKSVMEKHCVLDGRDGHVISRRDPAFTVVLFDEIEKASDSLWNLLLGILDKGTLTTGINEVVDFAPTVIIMTSNVGSVELAAKAGDGVLGFASPAVVELSSNDMTEIAMSAARKKFMPEFINRLDSTVMFNSLTPKDLEMIMRLELQKLQDRIILDSSSVFELSVAPAAYAKILEEGYDRRYNARNLKRTIDKYVSLPLARLVSTGQVMTNDVVVVDYDGDWIYFAQDTFAGKSAESVVFS